MLMSRCVHVTPSVVVVFFCGGVYLQAYGSHLDHYALMREIATNEPGKHGTEVLLQLLPVLGMLWFGVGWDHGYFSFIHVMDAWFILFRVKYMFCVTIYLNGSVDALASMPPPN